jgi:hypothetical protein
LGKDDFNVNAFSTQASKVMALAAAFNDSAASKWLNLVCTMQDKTKTPTTFGGASRDPCPQPGKAKLPN